MKNNVSNDIPEAVVEGVKATLEALKAAIRDYMYPLTAEERPTFARMGDMSYAFVEKAHSSALSKPHLTPTYVDVKEWGYDVDSFKKLTNIKRLMLEILQDIDDTIVVCGNEAHTASLKYYGAIQAAAASNVEGAKTIEADLGKRFAKNGPKRKKAVAEEETLK